MHISTIDAGLAALRRDPWPISPPREEDQAVPRGNKSTPSAGISGKQVESSRCSPKTAGTYCAIAWIANGLQSSLLKDLYNSDWRQVSTVLDSGFRHKSSTVACDKYSAGVFTPIVSQQSGVPWPVRLSQFPADKPGRGSHESVILQLVEKEITRFY